MKKRIAFTISEGEVDRKFRAKAYMKSINKSALIERLLKKWIGDTFVQENRNDN